MQPQISIIIPCYNEEENIGECIRRIPKLEKSSEILVVDDGSSDRTAEMARNAKRENIMVIRYVKNRGKGYAFRVGLKNARGEVVLIQDADMATPPEDIPNIVKPILEGRADFVNGTRFVYPMESGAMKSMHVFGNRVFAFLVSVMIRKWLTDTLCGFKAFRKSMLKGELHEDSWPDFELLFMAKKSGMRITEVPIHYKRRKAGESKMKTFSHAYKMFRMLARSLLGTY